MRARVLPVLLIAAVTMSACGGGDEGSGPATSPADSTSAPSASTEVATTTASPTTPSGADTTVASPATEAVTTQAPTTVPAELWSATAATHLDEVLASLAGPGTAATVAASLFGLPVSVPLPDDAVLSGVYIDVEQDDTGAYRTRWDLRFASNGDPAALEAAITAGLSDPRWEAGVRVESTLDSGIYVTLNYPATATGEADGWETLAVTVGPEAEGLTPTGRNEIQVAVDTTTPSRPNLPAFVVGWLAEMPVAPDLTLHELRATLTELSTTGVWMTATYRADPGRFADLVGFYAQDHSSGALVLEAYEPPADLTTVDRFSAGFFPTLAGYSVFASVNRDLAAPADPVTVELEVRVEPEE